MSLHKRNAERLIELGRLKEAELQMRLALAELPNDAYAHSLLAIILVEQKRMIEAEHEAHIGAELAPSSWYSLFSIAWVYNKKNNLDDALQAIDEAIRLNSGEVRNFILRAKILTRRREWEEVLSTADEGLRLDPTNIACAQLRAIALVKLGWGREASNSLRAALRNDPNNARTHANLGMVYLYQNDVAEASMHFEKALRIDPNLVLAQIGFLEASSAQELAYGVFRKTRSFTRIYLSIAGWLLILIALQLTDNFLISIPMILIYTAFAFKMWLAHPIYLVVKRRRKFGESSSLEGTVERSNLFRICVSLALLLAGVGIISNNAASCSLLIVAAEILALTLPVSVINLAIPDRPAFGFIAGYPLVLLIIVLIDLALVFSNVQEAVRFWIIYVPMWVAYCPISMSLLATNYNI